MVNKIAGTAYIKADGRQYSARGNFTVMVDPFEREGIAGQDGVHGYSEKPVVPYIEGDISDSPDFSIEDLQAVSDATVTLETASGKVYILRNAWAAGVRELDTEEGKIPVRFEGMSGEEIKS